MALRDAIDRRKFCKSAGLWVPALFAILHGLKADEQEAEGQVTGLPFFAPNSSCNYATNAKTTPWLARLSNTPSQQAINSLNCLMNGLDAAGLTSNILAMNLGDTTSLSNFFKPIMQGGHASDWTNNNFVSGDLNSNGLKGDGIGKYAVTVNQGNDYASNASAGLTLYISQAPSLTNAWDSGYTNDTGTETLFVQSKFSGNARANLWNNATSIITSTPGAGYYSLNRTATNVTKLYFANSVTPHAQLGPTDTSETGALTGQGIFLFSINHWNSGGSPTDIGFSDMRLALYVQHNGLTAAGSLALFNLLQQYLINRGGGSV